LLHKSDLILVMTKDHRKQVLERVPDVEPRVYPLYEFVQKAASGDVDTDIPDPMGQSSGVYEECLLTIDEAVTRVVNLL
jgi:protein-tyrosine-phosphatase